MSKSKIIIKMNRKSLYERYKNGELNTVIQNKGDSITDENEKLFFMGYLVANAINRGEVQFDES